MTADSVSRTADDPTIADLERVAALGWRGVEEERLGDWLLRAGHAFTGRANSVLPLGSPGVRLPEAFERVTRWYAERGLKPLIQVPLALNGGAAGQPDGGLDADLDRAGWRAFNRTHVMVGTVDGVLAAVPARPDLPVVVHETTPSDLWLRGYHYRGRPLPDGAIRVLVRAADPTFAAVVAPDTDSVLAVGRGVVDEGWLGVTAVTVAESERRRGLGSHVMRGLAEWAAERRGTRVYLQVSADNAPAVALYRGMGFTPHHDYHYRVRD